jgi:peptidylprolyl isomerase
MSMIGSQKRRITKTGLVVLSISMVLLVAAMLSAGCTSAPAGAKVNDTVKVYYNVSVEGGPVFESNFNGTPIEFTIGSGTLIKGFEQAVIGMTPGEIKQVTIPPEDAYGPVKPELINTYPRTGNLSTMDLQPGYMTYQTPDGKTGQVLILNVTPTTVTVDENHPLAGKTLVFNIQLVEIEKNTA